MKKTFTLAILTLFCFGLAIAQNIGIGTTNPASRLEIKGETADSAASGLNVTDSLGNSILFIRNDGKVGINSDSPHPSAVLDIQSQTSGVLVPRLSTVQRNNISGPGFGLLIYNTDENCLNFWNGSVWKELCGDCSVPDPIAGYSIPVCEGDTLFLNVSSVNGAAYSWTGPNGFTSPLQNPFIPNVSVSDTGLYMVTVTFGGCSKSGDVQVGIGLVPPSPVLWGDTLICDGDTLHLAVYDTLGVFTYSWTGPNGFSASGAEIFIPNAGQQEEGLYSVAAVLNGCTSNVATIMVTIQPVGLSDWDYKQELNIDNSSNNVLLSDYQMRHEFNHAALVTTGKALANGNDLRFTDSDRITPLFFWIESGLNTANCIVWVKVPTIPANANKTIYMFYGNVNATNASNGDSTFVLFDDFDDNTINSAKWGALNVSVYGGIAYVGNNVNNHDSLGSHARFSPGHRVRTKGILSSTSISHHLLGFQGYWFTSQWTNQSVVQANSTLGVSCNSGIATNVLGTPPITGIFMVNRGQNTNVGYVYNDALLHTDVNTQCTQNRHAHAATHEANRITQIDWIFVAKYHDPEPAMSAGSESSNGCVNSGIPNPCLPPAPGQMTGNDIFCESPQSYSINPVSGASGYVWAVPSGATILSGQGTTSVSVGFSGNSIVGPVSVAAQNNCGTGPSSILNVYACPMTDWPYRKPITITNPSNTQVTDYQTLVTVAHVAGKMNSDFSDLRFVDSLCTFLDYWVESFTSGVSAKVWVKVPVLRAAGTTIFVYYGNSSASSLSNGPNTFILYDDFNGSTLDTSIWTVEYGNPFVSNGELHLAVPSPLVSTKDKITSGSDHIGLCMEFGMRGYSGSRDCLAQFRRASDGAEIRVGDTDYQGHGFYNYAASPYSLNQTGAGGTTSAYREYRFKVYGNNYRATRETFLGSGVSLQSLNQTMGASVNNTDFYFAFSGGVGVNFYYGGYVDFVRVRKIMEPEPSVTVNSEIPNCP